jgi:DNA N-6-adenine-methyltransferase (Dam)
VEESRQITLLDGAAAALQAATTVGHVKEIRDRAGAAREYGRRAKDRRMIALADRVLYQAERRTGEILLGMKTAGELLDSKNGRRPKGSSVTRLSDLGISFDESARWQRLAKMPKKAFEETLKARFDRIVQRDVTPNGFLKTAFSSRSNEHLTPRVVLDAVLDVLGEIDLDPCAEKKGRGANVPALEHFIEKDDGLSKSWRGRVFMNPPYGDAVSAWVDYLAAAYVSGAVSDAIVLIAARTDTGWFNVKAFQAAPVCFVIGRLNFTGANTTAGSAPFPSAIFYLGKAHRAAFERRFSELGSIRPPAMITRRVKTK